MNKRNLKILTFGVTAFILIGAFAGCAKEEASSPVSGPQAGLSGSISVVGSTSVAPHAQKIADAFMAQNKGVKVDVQGVGSTAGVKAANEGAADIGMASRNLKTGEKEWGLDEHVIAYDGIAVVVNPENKVKDLTAEKVTAIFKGEITNWKEVGGADQEILIVSRESGSGTRGAFEELLELEEENDQGKKVSAVKTDALIAEGNGAVKANIASKSYSIGYISLSYIDDSVKAISIEGVEPSIENILAGSYGISRPFLMVSKGQLTDIGQAYLDFVFSEEGQAIVAENAIPVK